MGSIDTPPQVRDKMKQKVTGNDPLGILSTPANDDPLGILQKKNGGGNGLKPSANITSPSGFQESTKSFDITNPIQNVNPNPVDKLDVVEKQDFQALNGYVQPLDKQTGIVNNLLANRNNPIVKYNRGKRFLQQDIDNNSNQNELVNPSFVAQSKLSTTTDYAKLKQEVTDETETPFSDENTVPSVEYANQRKGQIEQQVKELQDKQYVPSGFNAAVTFGTRDVSVKKAYNYDQLQQQIDSLNEYKDKLMDYTEPIAKVQVYKNILSKPIDEGVNEVVNPSFVAQSVPFKPSIDYLGMGVQYRGLTHPIESDNKKNNLLLNDAARNKDIVATENYGYEADGLNVAADAIKIMHSNGKLDDNDFNTQLADIVQQIGQLDKKYPEVRTQRIKGALGQIIDRNRKVNETAMDAGDTVAGIGTLKSLYENIISGAPSESEIMDAVKELNDKGANITVEEAKDFINRVPDIGNTALIGRAVGGFANLINNVASTTGLISDAQYESAKYKLQNQFGNTPEKAIEQPQTIISTEGTAETNPNFLKPIENPQAGLHNWGYGTLNLVADGVGTLAKLALLTEATGGLADIALGESVGTEVTGYAINKAGELAAKTALSAGQKQTIGTIAGMYLDTYPEAYESSKQFIGEKEGGESARQMYASTMGLLNGIAWTILPADKVVHDIIDKTVTTGAEKFASLIPNGGINDIKQNTVKDFLVNTLTETAKAQGKIESISALTQVAQYAAQEMFNPQSVEQRNIGQEVLDGAIQGLSFLPVTLFEGRGLANKIDNFNSMQKEALYRISDDAANFKNYTNDQVKKGFITQDIANAKIKLINTMAEIKTEVPNELTKPEKVEYATNLLFRRKLESEKEGLKDPSQLKIIDKKIGELEKANDEILNNTTGIIPDETKQQQEPKPETPKIEIRNAQEETGITNEGVGEVSGEAEKSLVDKAREDKQLGIYGQFDNDQVLKEISKQAQNIQEDGSKSNLRTDEQAYESAVNNFGGNKELVDAAIEKYPERDLLSKKEENIDISEPNVQDLNITKGVIPVSSDNKKLEDVFLDIAKKNVNAKRYIENRGKVLGSEMEAAKEYLNQFQSIAGGGNRFEEIMQQAKDEISRKAEPQNKEVIKPTVDEGVDKGKTFFHAGNISSISEGSLISELGIHLGSKETADRISEAKGVDTKQYEVDIKNPIEVPDFPRWEAFVVSRKLNQDGILSDKETDIIKNKTGNDKERELIKILKSKGYDGFVYENAFEGGGKSYVAFDKSQVKEIKSKTPITETPKEESQNTNESRREDIMNMLVDMKSADYDYRITSDISQKEREKGVFDLRKGIESAAARKVKALVDNIVKEGVLPIHRGTGGMTEKFDIPFEHWFGLEPKERDAAVKLDDEITNIINNEGITKDNIDNFKHLFNEGGFPYTNEDFNNIKAYFERQNEGNAGSEKTRTKSEGSKEVATENAEGNLPPPKELQGKYFEKAKVIADKIRNADLPKWLINTDPTIKSAGVTGESLKNTFADAVEHVGKLLDKGIEIADAIKEGADKIINHLLTDYPKGAKLKSDYENQIRNGFENYYKENIKDNKLTETPTRKEPSITPPIENEGEGSENAGNEGVHINKNDISTATEIATKFPIQGGKVKWGESVSNGLDKLAKYAKKGESLFDAAKRKISEWGKDIDKELSEAGKATFNPTDEDLAVMSYARTNLHDQLKSIEENINSENQAERLAALTQAKDIQEQILLVDHVLSESGKVAGRSFYIRQAVGKMDAENNLQVRRMDIMRSQGGEPLTSEQEAAVAKVVAEENKLNKDGEKNMAKYSQEDFDAKVKEEVDRVLKERANNKNKKEKTSSTIRDIAKSIRTSNEFDKFLKASQGDITKAGVSVDLKELAAQALDHIANLVEAGEKIADAVKVAANKFKGGLDESDFKNMLTKVIYSPNDILKKIKDIDSQNLTKESVGKGLINDLVNNYIDSGLRGKDIFNELKNDVKEIYPEITDQQLRDAYLKTGEFKLDKKLTIDKEKRDAQLELKNISKLENKIEDAREGIAGSKTETEKRKWTSIENKLNAELKSELNKRNINLERNSKEENHIKKQTASTHNKRIDNFIKSIDEKLKDENISEEDKKLLNNIKNKAELSKVDVNTAEKIDKALIKASTNLRKEVIDLVGHQDLFNEANSLLSDLNKDLTDASQDILLQRYKKQLSNKIKEADRKIEAKEFDEESKPIRNKVDAETVRLEQEQRKIEAKYRRLKYLAGQKNKKWWEKGISLGQSFLVNELIGGIKTAGVVLSSGLTKQPLNTLTNFSFGSIAHALNPELSKAAGGEAPFSFRQERNRYLAHYAAIGEKGLEKKFENAQSNLDKATKAYNEAKKLYGNAKKGTPQYAKLAKAENNQLNALLSHQSLFLYKWIGTNAWKDAGQVFTKGASKLDELLGHEEPVGWKDMTNMEKTQFVMGTMGALHGTFKNFSARAEFAASFTARLENKSRNGIDISHPDEILKTVNESYLNFLMGKYQEDNYATTLMNRVGKLLEEVGSEPSRYGADRRPKNLTLGKLAAAAYRGKFPIIKTGVNIGREALQEYMIGSLWGGAVHGSKIVKGIFKGIKDAEPIRQSITNEIKKMSPDQVDLIFRCYRKGGFGLVMAGLAALGYIKFGGFYNRDDSHRRKKELHQGDVEIFGHDFDHKNIVAKVFTHAGATMPALMVGNTAQVYKRKFARGVDKGDATKAAEDAILSDFQGAMNVVPALNTGIGNPLTNPSIPYGRAVADISELFDTDKSGNLIKRDNTTWWNRFLINTGFRKLAPIHK